jgi:hypothetical protein
MPRRNPSQILRFIAVFQFLRDSSERARTFGTRRASPSIVGIFYQGETLMKTDGMGITASGSSSLTNADLLFCTLPIVIFLSIVSLV